MAEALGGIVPRIENVVFGNHIKGQGSDYLETFTLLITRPQTLRLALPKAHGNFETVGLAPCLSPMCVSDVFFSFSFKDGIQMLYRLTAI